MLEIINNLEDSQLPWQRTLYILVFSQLVVSMGFSSIYPFLPLYVAHLGSTTGIEIELLSGLVYSAHSFTMMIVSPIWGFLADRIGYRNILIGCTSVLAIVYTLQGYISFGWQLIILQGVVGICLGGLLPIISALLANYSKTVGEGSVFGLDNSINAAGRTLAPLVGTIILSFYGFPAAFATAGIVFLITSFLAFWKLPPSRSTP